MSGRPVEQPNADAIDGHGFVFGDRLGGQAILRGGAAVPAEASISFLQFSCAMMVKPAGKPAKPLTWSPSLCVTIAVSTGFGVILAISAWTSFDESTVVLVSTTMTPVCTDDDSSVSAGASLGPIDVVR